MTRLVHGATTSSVSIRATGAVEDDVLRVARRLHEIGAVKKMKLTYKPDVFTYDGRYEGNAPGDIAIYTCSDRTTASP